jgi:arginine repressor
MSDLNREINPSAEEYNKQILKQAAFTFSQEGISRDLKYFIQKKVTHNKTNLCYVTQLMDLAINSKSKEIIELAFTKNSSLKKLLSHVTAEIIKTDILLNRSIDFIIRKDPSIKGIKNVP